MDQPLQAWEHASKPEGCVPAGPSSLLYLNMQKGRNTQACSSNGWRDSVSDSDGLMVIISFGQTHQSRVLRTGLFSSTCQHETVNVTSYTETGQWAERRYGPIRGISPSFA